MTPREQAAYNAGVETVRQIAMIVAVTIEARHDAKEVKHRGAVAALQVLAEAAREMLLGEQPEPTSVPGQVPVSAQVASREAAVAQGFTGDACTTCGAFAMKRAGTCLTCQSCGSTTGCG